MEKENVSSVTLMILWYQRVGATPHSEILCESRKCHPRCVCVKLGKLYVVQHNCVT